MSLFIIPTYVNYLTNIKGHMLTTQISIVEKKAKDYYFAFNSK